MLLSRSMLWSVPQQNPFSMWWYSWALYYIHNVATLIFENWMFLVFFFWFGSRKPCLRINTGGAWRYTVSPDKHLESFMWTKLILMKEITTSDEKFSTGNDNDATLIKLQITFARDQQSTWISDTKRWKIHSYLLWTKRTLINFIQIYIIGKNCMVTVECTDSTFVNDIQINVTCKFLC